MKINIDEYWIVFNLIIHVDGSVEIVFTRQKLCKLPDMRRRATQLVKSIETMIYRGYWKSVRYLPTFMRRLSVSACKRHLLIQLKVRKSLILPLYFMELGLTFLTFLVWHVGLVVQTKNKNDNKNHTIKRYVDHFSFRTLRSAPCVWVSMDEKDYTVSGKLL